MDPISFDDRRLVKRLLAHDEQAFGEFFDGYFPRLYRFARTRVNDDPEATKDIVQMSLTKAIRKLHLYRGEAALFTWLCAICRNELNDYFERRGREREHFVCTEDFPDIQAAVDSFEAPPSDEPEHNFRRLETSRMIQVALDRLPVHYGNALEWKYIEGLATREIAERLDLGLEATNSLLARAKRAFHDVYGSLTESILEGDRRASNEAKP